MVDWYGVFITSEEEEEGCGSAGSIEAETERQSDRATERQYRELLHWCDS